MRPIQYTQLAITALLISLLASCQTTVPLDLGDNTPRLVINAVATTQEQIAISLSESKPTGVDGPNTHIYYDYDHPNCPYKMTLHVNDKLIPIPEIASYKPLPGDRIAISVEKTGLKTASAVTTVPGGPSVGEITVKKQGEPHRGSYAPNALGLYLESGQYLELQDYQLAIPILGATKDAYYRILVERQTVRPGESIRQDEYAWYQEQLQDPLLAQFASGDIFFESSNSIPMNLLAGANLPSSDYTVTSTLSLATKVLNKDGSVDDGPKTQTIADQLALRITVYAITADLYHYWQTSTSARYNNMGSLGLSEPILIYNNIQDGLGILGSMTASEVTHYTIEVGK